MGADLSLRTAAAAFPPGLRCSRRPPQLSHPFVTNPVLAVPNIVRRYFPHSTGRMLEKAMYYGAFSPSASLLERIENPVETTRGEGIDGEGEDLPVFRRR